MKKVLSILVLITFSSVASTKEKTVLDSREWIPGSHVILPGQESWWVKDIKEPVSTQREWTQVSFNSETGGWIKGFRLRQ